MAYHDYLLEKSKINFLTPAEVPEFLVFKTQNQGNFEICYGKEPVCTESTLKESLMKTYIYLYHWHPKLTWLTERTREVLLAHISEIFNHFYGAGFSLLDTSKETQKVHFKHEEGYEFSVSRHFNGTTFETVINVECSDGITLKRTLYEFPNEVTNNLSEKPDELVSEILKMFGR